MNMFPFVAVIGWWLSNQLFQVNGQCDSFKEFTNEGKALVKIFENVRNLPSWWASECDACDWDTNSLYIKCVNNDITFIDLSNRDISGELTIGQYMLPNELRYLNLANNKLNGTVAWGGLGLNLEWLDLGYNDFTGPIQIDKLSDDIQYVYLSHNHFSGRFNLTDYTQESDSKSLEYLFLTNNDLSGPIDFSQFPESLRYFFGGINNFNGIIDGSQIAFGIELLHLGNNSFEDIINIGSFPSSLTHFYAPDNDFRGNLDLTSASLLPSLRVLSLSQNNFNGTIPFSDLPSGLQELYLYSNDFTGSVDVGSLPLSLKSLFIQDNMLTGNIDLSMLNPNLTTFIADNNEFSGTLSLSMPDDSNLEHLWLFSNDFVSRGLNVIGLGPKMKQVIVGDNILGGDIDLDGIPSSLKYLLLDYNNFSIGVSFPFSIPDTCQIRLDTGVYCTQGVCDDLSQCAESGERSNSQCTGYTDCAKTCVCLACGVPASAPTINPSPYYAIHGGNEPNFTIIGDDRDTILTIESISLQNYSATLSPTVSPTKKPKDSDTLVDRGVELAEDNGLSETQAYIAFGGFIAVLCICCICCFCCIKICFYPSDSKDSKKQLHSAQSSTMKLMDGKSGSTPRGGSNLPPNGTKVQRARSMSGSQGGRSVISSSSPVSSQDGPDTSAFPPVGAPAMSPVVSNSIPNQVDNNPVMIPDNVSNVSGPIVGGKSANQVELMRMRSYSGADRAGLGFNNNINDPNNGFNSLDNMYQKMNDQMNNPMMMQNMSNQNTAASMYQNMMAMMLQYQNQLQQLRMKQMQQGYMQQYQQYQQKLLQMQNLLKQRAMEQQKMNHNMQLNSNIVNQVNLMQQQYQQQQQQQQMNNNPNGPQGMQHANTVRVNQQGGQGMDMNQFHNYSQSVMSLNNHASAPSLNMGQMGPMNNMNPMGGGPVPNIPQMQNMNSLNNGMNNMNNNMNGMNMGMNNNMGQMGGNGPGGEGGEGGGEGGEGGAGDIGQQPQQPIPQPQPIPSPQVQPMQPIQPMQIQQHENIPHAFSAGSAKRHNYSIGGASDISVLKHQETEAKLQEVPIEPMQTLRESVGGPGGPGSGPGTSAGNPVNTDDLVMDEFEDMYTSPGNEEKQAPKPVVQPPRQPISPRGPRGPSPGGPGGAFGPGGGGGGAVDLSKFQRKQSDAGVSVAGSVGDISVMNAMVGTMGGPGAGPGAGPGGPGGAQRKGTAGGLEDFITRGGNGPGQTRGNGNGGGVVLPPKIRNDDSDDDDNDEELYGAKDE